GSGPYFDIPAGYPHGQHVALRAVQHRVRGGAEQAADAVAAMGSQHDQVVTVVLCVLLDHRCRVTFDHQVLGNAEAGRELLEVAPRLASHLLVDLVDHRVRD